ncbi:MAG: transcription elongation factor subunit Spt4 [Candidatus Bathyarchaeia archaeon]
MTEMACSSCKEIFNIPKTKRPLCPNCKTLTLSENWSGLLIVLDSAGSEVGRKAGIKKEGAYAIKVGR